MKKSFWFVNSNIYKIVLIGIIFVSAMISSYVSAQSQKYLASFELKKLMSFRFIPKYSPSFCGELGINPEELKIGINPSFILGLTKVVSKPVLYAYTRYRMDKWLHTATITESRQQFFVGFDKKVDTLIDFIVGEVDLDALSDSLDFMRMYGNSIQQNDAVFTKHERVAYTFFNRIDQIFNMHAITAKVVGIFAINILVKTYLFKLFLGKQSVFDMCWRISTTICSDPFNIEVIRKEAELTMANMMSNLGNELSLLGDKLSPDLKSAMLSKDFFSSKQEILKMKTDLQQVIMQAEQKPDPIVPADLMLDYAINYDLPECVNEFWDGANVRWPGFMKSYWYWFFKELFIFWSVSANLKNKFHVWISGNLGLFINSIRKIAIAKNIENHSKTKEAKEEFRVLLKKVLDEKFSYKKFLQGMLSSFAIDLILFGATLRLSTSPKETV